MEVNQGLKNRMTKEGNWIDTIETGAEHGISLGAPLRQSRVRATGLFMCCYDHIDGYGCFGFVEFSSQLWIVRRCVRFTCAIIPTRREHMLSSDLAKRI